MANKMDAGRETGDETKGPLKVSWLSEPLDVTIFRNGAKLPRRKVKVEDQGRRWNGRLLEIWGRGGDKPDAG